MEATETTQTETVELSGSKKVLQTTGWAAVTFFFLIFFTALKLPQEKIKSWVNAYLYSTLSPMGMQLSSSSAEIGFIPLPSYNVSGVQFKLSPTSVPLTFDQGKASVAVFPIFRGELGTAVSAEIGSGSLALDLSTPVAPKKGAAAATLAFEISDLSLAKSGLLAQLYGIQGTGTIEGKGSVSGDFNNPTSLGGTIQLTLKKIQLAEQTLSLSGFSLGIPSIAISDGKMDITIDKGKVAIKSLYLGKKGSADDILVESSGDVQLGRSTQTHQLNLKVKLSYSEKLKKTLGLAETFMKPALQPDGSYSYAIAGLLGAPSAVPAK
jgi:type II secretion system protein N